MQDLTDAAPRGDEHVLADERERRVTDEVLASFDDTPDERLREILRSLVEHLHGFARDVRLTEAEWTQGIEFLTRVGHITDDRRQEFILLSDVLGLSMLTVGINAPDEPEATESTVFGPFFVEDSPEIELGGDIAEGVSGRAVLGRGPRHRRRRVAAGGREDRGLGGRRRRLLRRPAGRDAVRPRPPVRRRRGPLRLLVGQAGALPDPRRRPGRRPPQGRPPQPLPPGAHPLHGQPPGPPDPDHARVHRRQPAPRRRCRVRRQGVADRPGRAASARATDRAAAPWMRPGGA